MNVTAIERALFLVLAALMVAHLCGEYLVLERGQLRDGLIAKFYLDYEKNIPTFYSSCLWVLCAVAAWMIGSETRLRGLKLYLPWMGLSLLFLFLGADEMLEIHEALLDPMREVTGGEGWFFQAWLFAYGGLVIIGGLLLWPFLRQLPRILYWRVALAAGVFLSGALGLEAVGGFWIQNDERDTWAYSLIVGAEESLEMLGLILLMSALLKHIARHLRAIQFVHGQRPAPLAEVRRRDD